MFALHLLKEYIVPPCVGHNCPRHRETVSANSGKSEFRAGDSLVAVGSLFDIDEGYLDAAAALGSGLQRGYVHVIRKTHAEIAEIQSHIRDQGIGDIAEPTPKPYIDVRGVLLVGAGGDLPGTPEHVIARTCLVVEKGADIDGAGRARDGEITSA